MLVFVVAAATTATLLVIAVVSARPLPCNGGMGKTMDPQKPGNSPWPRAEVLKRQRVAKERAAQRVRSWTGKNKIRGVLGRVSTGTARRILDSANPREIGAK